MMKYSAVEYSWWKFWCFDPTPTVEIMLCLLHLISCSLPIIHCSPLLSSPAPFSCTNLPDQIDLKRNLFKELVLFFVFFAWFMRKKSKNWTYSFNKFRLRFKLFFFHISYLFYLIISHIFPYVYPYVYPCICPCISFHHFTCISLYLSLYFRNSHLMDPWNFFTSVSSRSASSEQKMN